MERQMMSSLEIAELCGKRHDTVMHSIRVMFLDLWEFDISDYESTYVDKQYKERACYVLPCSFAFVLVVGYTGKRFARNILEWPIEIQFVEFLSKFVVREIK